MVIDDDKETARKTLQQISRIPEEQINEFAIYGAPEDVFREKESLQDACIQYLIVDLEH